MSDDKGGDTTSEDTPEKQGWSNKKVALVSLAPFSVVIVILLAAAVYDARTPWVDDARADFVARSAGEIGDALSSMPPRRSAKYCQNYAEQGRTYASGWGNGIVGDLDAMGQLTDKSYQGMSLDELYVAAREGAERAFFEYCGPEEG